MLRALHVDHGVRIGVGFHGGEKSVEQCGDTGAISRICGLSVSLSVIPIPWHSAGLPQEASGTQTLSLSDFG